MQTVESADPATPVLDSMNHNVESRVNAALGGSRLVRIGWIRNVQPEVKITLRITTIDFVNALRCFVVPFLFLCADRITTERYLIRFQSSAIREHG